MYRYTHSSKWSVAYGKQSLKSVINIEIGSLLTYVFNDSFHPSQPSRPICCLKSDFKSQPISEQTGASGKNL